MNNLFKSLASEVITKTNRPSLIAETSKAIRDATLFYHSRGKFKKDANFVILQATNQATAVTRFQLPQDARIRQIIGVQPVGPNGELGNFLKELELGQQASRCSAYFQWMNSSLTIKVPEIVSQFQLYYLAYPSVEEGSYNSWIAQTYPHFITDLAAARVLLDIGIADKARNLMSLVGEFRAPGSHVWTLIHDNPEIKINASGD